MATFQNFSEPTQRVVCMILAVLIVSAAILSGAAISQLAFDNSYAAYIQQR